jgi:hypothetical protein
LKKENFMTTEPVDYSAIIADLEAKRAALDATITAFRAAQAAGALGISVGDSIPATGDDVSLLLRGNEVPVGAFLGKSIPESAKLCLQIVKRKMTSKEIAEYLKKGGIESTAQNFPALVHSIILRASRTGGSPIVKLDRSYWGLAEWYPSSMRSGTAPEKRANKRRRGRPRKSEPKTEPTEPKEKKLGLGPVGRITLVLRGKPGTEFSAEDIAEPAQVSVQVARLLLGRIVASKQAEKTSGGKYRAITVN